MYVRNKKRPNHTDDDMNIAVQVVATEYVPGKHPKQTVLHHVGIARGDKELRRLRRLGEVIRHALESEESGSLYTPDQLPDPDVKPEPARLRVDLEKVSHERETITGIHQVFGEVYKRLGLRAVLPASRYRASHQILFNVVMARLGNPMSKRATAAYLAAEMGSETALEGIYRMMDMLTDTRIERMKKLVRAANRTLMPMPVDIMFVDCTTVYFESVKEDDLKTFGYSKDGKSNRVQVLLALVVDDEGLPLTYQLFQGNTYEGHALKAIVDQLKDKHLETRQIMVADAGMLSKKNLEILEAESVEYVTGARLRNLTATDTQVLHDHPWTTRGHLELDLGNGRRLVAWHSEKRAKRDRALREKRVERLTKRLAKSSDPVKWVKHRQPFIKIVEDEETASDDKPAAESKTSTQVETEVDAKVLDDSEAAGETSAETTTEAKGKRKQKGKRKPKGKVVLDEEAIAYDSKWDGLGGVVTNTDLEVDELRARYRDLWLIERSFRVNKTDLRMRPVFHWTERRIHAHIAICYMAFACLRQVEYTLALKNVKLSPRKILDAVRSLKDIVVRDAGNQRLIGLPSKPSETATEILRTLKIRRSNKTYLLEENA